MMWSYLICVNSEIEADIIHGLLEEAQIPVQKKYPGGLKASYGIINGVEVWVPSDSLGQARELLTTLPQDIENTFESSNDSPTRSQNGLNPLDTDSDKPSPRRLSKPVVISFILVLFVLLYWLIKGLDLY